MKYEFDIMEILKANFEKIISRKIAEKVPFFYFSTECICDSIRETFTKNDSLLKALSSLKDLDNDTESEVVKTKLQRYSAIHDEVSALEPIVTRCIKNAESILTSYKKFFNNVKSPSCNLSSCKAEIDNLISEFNNLLNDEILLMILGQKKPFVKDLFDLFIEKGWMEIFYENQESKTLYYSVDEIKKMTEIFYYILGIGGQK